MVVLDLNSINHNDRYCNCYFYNASETVKNNSQFFFRTPDTAVNYQQYTIANL